MFNLLIMLLSIFTADGPLSGLTPSQQAFAVIILGVFLVILIFFIVWLIFNNRKKR